MGAPHAGIAARSSCISPASSLVRIATYNLNGVDGRSPRLLEWLEETKPDLACMQEIKTGDATAPAAKMALPLRTPGPPGAAESLNSAGRPPLR